MMVAPTATSGTTPQVQVRFFSHPLSTPRTDEQSIILSTLCSKDSSGTSTWTARTTPTTPSASSRKRQPSSSTESGKFDKLLSARMQTGSLWTG